MDPTSGHRVGPLLFTRLQMAPTRHDNNQRAGFQEAVGAGCRPPVRECVTHREPANVQFVNGADGCGDGTGNPLDIRLRNGVPRQPAASGDGTEPRSLAKRRPPHRQPVPERPAGTRTATRQPLPTALERTPAARFPREQSVPVRTPSTRRSRHLVALSTRATPLANVSSRYAFCNGCRRSFVAGRWARCYT